MTWTRLSDDHADRPDLLAVSRSARHLHTEALVYCNRHGNDGRFRRTLVARMTDAEDWPALIDELLTFRIWRDLGDGHLEIEWAAWGQEPAKEVRARRDANAERQKLYRDRGRLHAQGDHSQCTRSCPARAESRNASRAASRSASRNALRDATPIRPVPSEGKGRDGQASSAGSASAPPARGPDDRPAAHDYTWQLGDPAQDDAMLRTDRPCADCGQPYEHPAHAAHPFTGHPDGRCPDCGGLEDHADHHYPGQG